LSKSDQDNLLEIYEVRHERRKITVEIAELKKSQSRRPGKLLPGRFPKAVEFYARAALKAGCAYINVTPSNIVGNASLVSNFLAAKTSSRW
jgi:myo-inositol-1-phosphate synthase